MNSILSLAIFIYLITQFLGAMILLLKHKRELILIEKNEVYRDAIASIVFSILGVFIYSENYFQWKTKTPIVVILILFVFAIFQIRRKRLEKNVDEGVKSSSFIYYSWLLTRFSGLLLLGSALFCLVVNIIYHH